MKNVFGNLLVQGIFSQQRGHHFSPLPLLPPPLLTIGLVRGGRGEA